MPKNHQAVLMIATSEHDANLYYATRFVAPDDFIFVETGGKKYMLMSDLEVDRARSQAKVHEVVSTTKLRQEYQKKHGKTPGQMDLLEEFLKRKGAKNLVVPANFQIAYGDSLRKRGFDIQWRQDPFFEKRTVKTPVEIKAIEKAIRHTENAVGRAIAALKKSVIKGGKLYYQGKVLTCEAVKKIINVSLMEDDCIAAHSIVASGIRGVDPHDEGSGPVFANQSLIMDIFPRDSQSRYFADFTRTVVRGKANPKLKKMYAAVKEGQEIAFKMIRDGIDGSAVHGAIQKRFDALGFKTGVLNGRMQGFFHGTGHGLGLDIHEAPRVSLGSNILKAGQVVTVEPGLYYEDAGGVRLEDVVVVTKTSCRNLTRFPKILEI